MLWWWWHAVLNMCQPFREIIVLFLNSKNAEWSVVSSVAETRIFSETKPSGTVRTYSVINFTITIKRNPSHYISSTILPVLATSVLSSLVFILPVESGEKVGYTLTEVNYRISSHCSARFCLGNNPCFCYTWHHTPFSIFAIEYTLTVLLAETVLLTLVQDSMPSSSHNTSYLCMYLR
jgi:hypothetical protein